MKVIIIGLSSMTSLDIFKKAYFKSDVPMWIRDTKGFPGNLNGSSRKADDYVGLIDDALTKAQEDYIERMYDIKEELLKLWK